MDSEDRRFAWAEGGEECLDRECDGALAGIVGGLMDQIDGVGRLPVAGGWVEVEGDDAGAGHLFCTGVSVVRDDDRGGDEEAGRVGHVAEAIHAALHSEVDLGLDLDGGKPGVS
jgi:hypothetical protein